MLEKYIIFVTTIRGEQGFCDIIYSDGTTDTIGLGIGEIYNALMHTSFKNQYVYIDRSTIVCKNNIVMIHPSQCKLVIAFDSLEKRHMELSFSDEILRRLRGELYNVN